MNICPAPISSLPLTAQSLGGASHIPFCTYSLAHLLTPLPYLFLNSRQEGPPLSHSSVLLERGLSLSLSKFTSCSVTVNGNSSILTRFALLLPMTLPNTTSSWAPLVLVFLSLATRCLSHLRSFPFPVLLPLDSVICTHIYSPA